MENLTFKEECTGFHSGETVIKLTALYDGKAVGFVEYSVFHEVPYINYIEVKSQYRNKGIGSELIKYIAKDFGYHNVNFGMMTDDGVKLQQKLDKIFKFNRNEYNKQSYHYDKEILKVLKSKNKQYGQFVYDLYLYGDIIWDKLNEYPEVSNSKYINELGDIAGWISGSKTNNHNIHEEIPEYIHERLKDIFHVDGEDFIEKNKYVLRLRKGNMNMRPYKNDDFDIILTACKNAYAFGGGCLSYSKNALHLNDIVPPKNLDSLVFKATEMIEREEKKQSRRGSVIVSKIVKAFIPFKESLKTLENLTKYGGCVELENSNKAIVKKALEELKNYYGCTISSKALATKTWNICIELGQENDKYECLILSITYSKIPKEYLTLEEKNKYLSQKDIQKFRMTNKGKI